MNTGFSFFLSLRHPNNRLENICFLFVSLQINSKKTILRQEMPIEYFSCLRIVLYWRGICHRPSYSYAL